MTAPDRVVERIDDLDVRITRSEGKPLMILVRMASGGMGIWDTVWNDLAIHYSVANFDLGATAALSQELSPRERFERLADKVAEIAAALGYRAFHVFGWYGGAHVALACLLRFPDRLRSAVLLDPFFELPDSRKIEKAIAFKRRLFESEDRELYSYYWVMAGFTPGFLEQSFDTVERLARARIDADRFVSLDADRWMRWVKALRTNWLSNAELAEMKAPVLVLATALDNWHAGPTLGMAQALASRLPAARLSTIEGYGTFFFIERPQLLLHHAGDFLAEQARLGT
jgi:pimeloyl-ACP methyl ester carboxylesterase